MHKLSTTWNICNRWLLFFSVVVNLWLSFLLLSSCPYFLQLPFSFCIMFPQEKQFLCQVLLALNYHRCICDFAIFFYYMEVFLFSSLGRSDLYPLATLAPYLELVLSYHSSESSRHTGPHPQYGLNLVVKHIVTICGGGEHISWQNL